MWTFSSTFNGRLVKHTPLSDQCHKLWNALWVANAQLFWSDITESQTWLKKISLSVVCVSQWNSGSKKGQCQNKRRIKQIMLFRFNLEDLVLNLVYKLVQLEQGANWANVTTWCQSSSKIFSSFMKQFDILYFWKKKIIQT